MTVRLSPLIVISKQIYKTKTKVQNKGSLLVFTAAPTEWGSLLSESQNYPGDSAESKKPPVGFEPTLPLFGRTLQFR